MKSEKIIAVMIFVLGLACFLMYFIYGRGMHVVSFNSNGGSNVESQYVKDNELAFEPSIPIREGYQFDGWYLDYTIYDFRTAVTESYILNAKWKKIYNVIIKIDDQENSYQLLEEDIIDMDKLNIPIKEGYIRNLYYNNELYNLDTPINNDLYLELRYEES